MAVKLHRCRFVGYKGGHPCWQVQAALDEQGIAYEIVKAPTFPRGRRKEVIEHTGQHFLPAIEFEDGSWYRESSKTMAAEIAAGRLLEKRSEPSEPDDIPLGGILGSSPRPREEPHE